MVFDLDPNYRQLILRASLKQTETAENKPLDIGQFERYTFIKSLNFIRFRPRQKITHIAKILSYTTLPALTDIGMLDAYSSIRINSFSMKPITSISGRIL